MTVLTRGGIPANVLARFPQLFHYGTWPAVIATWDCGKNVIPGPLVGFMPCSGRQEGSPLLYF